MSAEQTGKPRKFKTSVTLTQKTLDFLESFGGGKANKSWAIESLVAQAIARPATGKEEPYTDLEKAIYGAAFAANYRLQMRGCPVSLSLETEAFMAKAAEYAAGGSREIVRLHRLATGQPE